MTESLEDPGDYGPRISGDAFGVPRGRCEACKGCQLWEKRCTTGPFAHTTCGGCGCSTKDHEDLTPWLRQVLDRSNLNTQSLLQKGIPVEACLQWCPLGTRFFLETDERFHPVKHGRQAGDGSGGPASRGSRRALCSVICPTSCKRHAFHPLLYQCYGCQSYQPRELIVIDTGSEPSAFLLERASEDPTLVYRWFRDADWSIGLKRNLACFLAQGEVVVHFDDDDMYARAYLARMVGEVVAAARHGRGSSRDSSGSGKSCADGVAAGAPSKGVAAKPLRKMAAASPPLVAVTLASWYVFDTKENAFRLLNAVSDKWVYGWGFSFAYTKEAWRACFFPHENVGEDYSFMTRLKAHPAALVLAIREKTPICSHTYHPRLNVSGGELGRDEQKYGLKVQAPEQFKDLLAALLVAEAQVRSTEPPPHQPPAAAPPSRAALAVEPAAPEATPTEEPAERAKVALTLEQGERMVDELINAFSSADFQARLSLAWDSAGGDSKKQLLARQQVSLPVQVPVVVKYGFENSVRGVYDSVGEFLALTQQSPALLGDKGSFLNWLCSPSHQRQTRPDHPYHGCLRMLQQAAAETVRSPQE